MAVLRVLRKSMHCCRTPLAAGVAQNFVNLSLDILLVVALGVGVVCLCAHWAELLFPYLSERCYRHHICGHVQQQLLAIAMVSVQ